MGRLPRRLTNYSVQARVKPLSFNGSNRFAALTARVQSSTNYYYLALSNSNQLLLESSIGGASTTLASKSLTVTTGTWYTLGIDVVGAQLWGYVNGALELTATDSQFGSGNIGAATFNTSDRVRTTSSSRRYPGLQAGTARAAYGADSHAGQYAGVVELGRFVRGDYLQRQTIYNERRPIRHDSQRPFNKLLPTPGRDQRRDLSLRGVGGELGGRERQFHAGQRDAG